MRCNGHVWNRLYVKPSDETSIVEYALYGYVDIRECERCGAIGFVSVGGLIRKYTLKSAQNRHREQSAKWNSKHAASCTKQ